MSSVFLLEKRFQAFLTLVFISFEKLIGPWSEKGNLRIFFWCVEKSIKFLLRVNNKTRENLFKISLNLVAVGRWHVNISRYQMLFSNTSQ